MSAPGDQRRNASAAATVRAAALHRRALLKSATAIAALGTLGLRAPAALGQAKPFAGVTINGAGFQHVSTENIKSYIP